MAEQSTGRKVATDILKRLTEHGNRARGSDEQAFVEAVKALSDEDLRGVAITVAQLDRAQSFLVPVSNPAGLEFAYQAVLAEVKSRPAFAGPHVSAPRADIVNPGDRYTVTIPVALEAGRVRNAPDAQAVVLVHVELEVGAEVEVTDQHPDDAVHLMRVAVISGRQAGRTGVLGRWLLAAGWLSPA